MESQFLICKIGKLRVPPPPAAIIDSFRDRGGKESNERVVIFQRVLAVSLLSPRGPGPGRLSLCHPQGGLAAAQSQHKAAPCIRCPNWAPTLLGDPVENRAEQ